MWFSTRPNRLLETPMIEGLELKWVCYLMTKGVACWDENLMEALFSPIDVIVIMIISLSTRQVEDNIIQHHTKISVYSCKSTYHVVIDINKPNLGDHTMEIGVNNRI